MSQPSREGASFGKFLRLRLEVNYMDGFSLENRATRNMATNARETNADILRNRTQWAAVCRYCSSSSKIVTSSASQKRRTPGNNLKHGLRRAWRSLGLKLHSSNFDQGMSALGQKQT
jgi:hypothetical protein